jgi:UDP-glucuronate decarboxylase
MRDNADVGSKRILVTGAAGFLGSFLCERLVNAGHHVLGIDNFSTGRKRNIAHLLGHPRFDLREHDVVKPFADEAGFDEIYNLACPASPVHYQSDPVQTTKTCVHGAINMLDLARESGARILQASTSEIYGDPEIHPQPEGYRGNVSSTGPRACYDEGKRCAESLFFDYHREYGVPIKVVRIFNTYGPRMDPQDGRVVSNFIVKALSGEDITIYGDGLQTRSFCFVDDLIEGFIRMMATDDEVIGPVNLGNPEEFTMLELADLIIEATGAGSKTVFLPLPKDDPTRRRPEISLAKELLGWSPTMPLRLGLAETIAHFDALITGKARATNESASEVSHLPVSAAGEVQARKGPGFAPSKPAPLSDAKRATSSFMQPGPSFAG